MKQTSNMSIGLILFGIAVGMSVDYLYNLLVLGFKGSYAFSSFPMFLGIYFMNKK